MANEEPCLVVDDARDRAPDEALAALLHRVYVGGGFTDADVAETAFTPEAVRARGLLLCARAEGGALAGTVIVVPPGSPARRLAAPDEAEMQLLAVDPAQRGRGVGAALVRAAIRAAREAGYRGMVLWTQPTMHAAHRLYEQAGFARSPGEDFARGGRAFQVYRRRFDTELRRGD